MMYVYYLPCHTYHALPCHTYHALQYLSMSYLPCLTMPYHVIPLQGIKDTVDSQPVSKDIDFLQIDVVYVRMGVARQAEVWKNDYGEVWYGMVWYGTIVRYHSMVP